MKKVLCLLLSFAMAFLLGSSGAVLAIDNEVTANADAQIQEPQTEFADDRVLVVLNNSASISSKKYTTADFSNIGCAEVKHLTQASSDMVQAKLSGVSVASVLENSVADRLACMNEINTETFQKILCLKLEEPGKENVLKAIEQLKKRPDVVSAEPDYIISLAADPIIPDDPYYGQQWAPAKISLPQAWDINTCDASVYVGVLDSGIDSSHPDLQNRLSYTGNMDFTSGSGVLGGKTDPYGHGTHVAGIIAGVPDNKVGIAGVCWMVYLTSLRVLNSSGRGNISNVISAINHAQSRGIPILNMSLGGPADSLEQNSLRTAINNYSGLVVCAAGNDSQNIDNQPVYPASLNCSNMIVVGASNQSDAVASFSNYGSSSVDLFAPGERILSTFPEAQCGRIFHTVFNSSHYQNGYHYLDGTSMATPYVTGVAALILAEHPNLSATTIKQWILNGVDKVSTLSGRCVTGGRLNAYKATNNHVYTYTDYGNATTHKCTCSCGYIMYESHNWQSMSIIDSVNDGDSTEAVVTQFCGKCGRRR